MLYQSFSKVLEITYADGLELSLGIRSVYFGTYFFRMLEFLSSKGIKQSRVATGEIKILIACMEQGKKLDTCVLLI